MQFRLDMIRGDEYIYVGTYHKVETANQEAEYHFLTIGGYDGFRIKCI
jgi:hypothetical protein